MFFINLIKLLFIKSILTVLIICILKHESRRSMSTLYSFFRSNHIILHIRLSSGVIVTAIFHSDHRFI